MGINPSFSHSYSHKRNWIQIETEFETRNIFAFRFKFPTLKKKTLLIYVFAWFSALILRFVFANTNENKVLVDLLCWFFKKTKLNDKIAVTVATISTLFHLMDNNILFMPFWGVWFLFYGPSTHFRSFQARSVTLTTLFLGKPPRQFTRT